jgi:hypothetical protein
MGFNSGLKGLKWIPTFFQRHVSALVTNHPRVDYFVLVRWNIQLAMLLLLIPTISRITCIKYWSNLDSTVFDVQEPVHRDTTVKITNNMHYRDQFIIQSRLYMFRAMFSPIIRSTWLYLQYLIVFTQVAAGWKPAATWVNTTVADSSKGVTNTRWCKNSCLSSWWWVVVPPETCRAVCR